MNTHNEFDHVRFEITGLSGFPGLPGEDEDSDYLRAFKMALRACPCEEHAREDSVFDQFPQGWTLIGWVTGCLFLGGSALNDEQDIWDHADAIGGDQESAAVAMYDDAVGLINTNDQVMESCAHNMLLIHNVWVEPPYRGHHISRFMIRRAIDFSDSASLGAVLIYPKSDHFAQHGTAKDLLPPAASDSSNGHAKLRAHFARMGFKDHPRMEEFMFLPMTPNALRKIRRHPTAKDGWWKRILA